MTLTSVTLDKNLIINNGVGISIDKYGGGIIQDNTIAKNFEGGIYYANSGLIITGNNFDNNAEYNFFNGRYTINATYNWWGTANQQVIGQTIKDSENNYNRGTVTFVPFLTASNSEAPAIG